MKTSTYTLDGVYSGLAAHGAMLWPQGTAPVADLETLLAHALRHAHDDPTLARSLPVVFWRNRDALDLGRLAHMAAQMGQTPTLGFFLEQTARHLDGWAAARKQPLPGPMDFRPDKG